MTVVKVQLDNNTSRHFRGQNIEEALKKLRRSPTAVRALSKLGVTWTKTLVWPVVKPPWLKRNNSDAEPHTETLRNVFPLLSQTDGTAEAELDFGLESRQEFTLELSGLYDAIETQFSVEKTIRSPAAAKELLKTAFNYLLKYNFSVNRLSVELSSDPRTAHLNASVSIPSTLRRVNL